MIKQFLAFLLFATSLFAGEIKIAVAANVSYALPQLIKSFNKEHPNIKVSTTLASSGTLTAQIRQGARYGLFLSADEKYPNYLFKAGLALSRPTVYAQGALALFSSKPLKCSKRLECLQEKRFRKIALASPKTAPYGKAALEVLQTLKLDKKLHHKLVYAESIAQTLSYALIAADVAFIAKSTLFSSKMKSYHKGEHWIDLDTHLYRPITQAMILLKGVKNRDEYAKFYHFLQTQTARDILKNFGYTFS